MVFSEPQDLVAGQFVSLLRLEEEKRGTCGGGTARRIDERSERVRVRLTPKLILLKTCWITTCQSGLQLSRMV